MSFRGKKSGLTQDSEQGGEARGGHYQQKLYVQQEGVGNKGCAWRTEFGKKEKKSAKKSGEHSRGTIDSVKNLELGNGRTTEGE